MKAVVTFAVAVATQSADNMKDQGLIIVYTGNGKGKTTAALGIAIRSAGWQNRVAIVQFIKGYKETGEWKFLNEIPQIDIYQTLDDKKRGIGKPEEKHKKAVASALKLVNKIIKENKYQVVVLDEVNNALHHGLLEAGKIMKLIKGKPVGMTLVFTGRDAPKELIEAADLVTEMTEIKHPFQKKMSAKRGIDY